MMTVDVEAINYINTLIIRAESAEKKLEDLKKEYDIHIKKMKEDLAEYERVANSIYDLTQPYGLDESPIGDFAEQVQDRVPVILKGRERPEWTTDRLARERDEARAELHAVKARLEDPALEYTQADVNKLTDEMIAVRKEYEVLAFKRGAEYMREASEKECLKIARSESYFSPNVGDDCAEAIRNLPFPDYSTLLVAGQGHNE